MTTGFQIYDQSATYFLTFQVVEWVDIFTRPHYKEIITNSFDYCRKEKGLQLNGYVIMTNHLHLIASARNDFYYLTRYVILRNLLQIIY